jgi:pimeloyl-ACP methyl ester carboxylesterase
MSGFTEVTTPDGRTLEVLTGGAEDGYPLLFHNGTPSAAAPYDRLDEMLVKADLRSVTYSRPGYGGSTPRDHSGAGPRIADDVDDSVTILDHLGIHEFITLGWSGGGPRALACAALLPGRCRAAATLAGVAPFDAEGLDWSAGMGPENVEDFEAAVQGRDVYTRLLEKTLPPVFEATPEQIVAAFGGLVTEVDAAFITGDFADYLSRVFGRAGAQGIVGAREDGLAIVAPWGFDLDDLTVPVAVWQGRHDAMVPFSHGEWLGANVAGARAHLFDDEGHLSLFSQLDEILIDLRELGGV